MLYTIEEKTLTSLGDAVRDKVFKNEEIATMIYTIGADYGESFDLKKCNYKKIIFIKIIS